MSVKSVVILQNNDTYFYLTWSSSMGLFIKILVQNIEVFNGALPCPQQCPALESRCTASLIIVNEVSSRWKGYLHILLYTWVGGLTAGKVVVG